MCGGSSMTSEQKSNVELPKVRKTSAVLKDGGIRIRFNGFDYFLELIDLGSTYNKEQQEAAYIYDEFTKQGNPVVDSLLIDSTDLAVALLKALGAPKPRKGGATAPFMLGDI